MLMLAKTPFLRRRAAPVGVLPTFVAAGSGVGGSNSVNVPYFAGVAANQIAFIFGATQVSGSTGQVFSATGFTQVQDPITHFNGSNTLASQVLWKRLTGSESGTVNVTFGTSGNMSVVMFGISGAITTGNPYEAQGQNSGQGTVQAGASITTTDPNRLGLRFGADFTGALASPPVGWTERVDITPTCSHRVDTIPIPAATTVAASSVSLSGSAQWNVHTLAMIPA